MAEKKVAPVVPCDHIKVTVELSEPEFVGPIPPRRDIPVEPNKNGDAFPAIQRLKEVAGMTARAYQEHFVHKNGKMIPIPEDPLVDQRLAHAMTEALAAREGIVMNKGDRAELLTEDGAYLGQVVYTGKGRFVVPDDPMDIKIGKEFWFLAGQFDGDPTVSHGKVVAYQFWHDEALLKPRCKLRMKLENGHLADCYDTDLHLTREAAEKARALQLEEEQG